MHRSQLYLVERWAQPPREAFVVALRLRSLPSPHRALAQRLASS